MRRSVRHTSTYVNDLSAGQVKSYEWSETFWAKLVMDTDLLFPFKVTYCTRPFTVQETVLLRRQHHNRKRKKKLLFD